MSSAAFAGSPDRLILEVQNMTCAACPIIVKKALEKVPGVSDVRVDLKNKTATVLISTDKTNVAMLTKAPTDAGFPSTLRK